MRVDQACASDTDLVLDLCGSDAAATLLKCPEPTQSQASIDAADVADRARANAASQLNALADSVAELLARTPAPEPTQSQASIDAAEQASIDAADAAASAVDQAAATAAALVAKADAEAALAEAQLAAAQEQLDSLAEELEAKAAYAESLANQTFDEETDLIAALQEALGIKTAAPGNGRSRRTAGTNTSSHVLTVLAGEKAAAGADLSGHLASKYTDAELREMLAKANGELANKKSSRAQLLETTQNSIARLQSNYTAATDQQQVASAALQSKQATLAAQRTASAQANATALQKQAEQAAAAADPTAPATATTTAAVTATDAPSSSSSVDTTTKALVVVTFVFILILTVVVAIVAVKTLGGKDHHPRRRSMKIKPFETPTAMPSVSATPASVALPETRPASREHVTAVINENTILSQKANNVVKDEKAKARRTTAAKIEQRRVQNHTAL